RVGGQGQRLRRKEDRQRSPALGAGRGGVPDAALPRAGQGVAEAPGEEGEQGAGVGGAGGQAGADRVSPVALASGFRRREVLDELTPARRGELEAELGHARANANAATARAAATATVAAASVSRTPLPLDWPPRRRPEPRRGKSVKRTRSDF